MSHMHLPDGVLPFWLWFSGFIIIALYLIFVRLHFKRSNPGKKYALVGILSALMLVAMSIEVPFIPYHINLAALSGIILGPLLSVVSILVVNIMLAFLGHGGFSVIGLNTLAISTEAIAAYFIFRYLRKHHKNIFSSAFISTVTALILSTVTAIGIVYSGIHNVETGIHTHDHEKHEEIEHHEESDKPFDIRKFIAFIFTFGLTGWILEALITAFIINYISQIKPDILSIGDEQYENC